MVGSVYERFQTAVALFLMEVSYEYSTCWRLMVLKMRSQVCLLAFVVVSLTSDFSCSGKCYGFQVLMTFLL